MNDFVYASITRMGLSLLNDDYETAGVPDAPFTVKCIDYMFPFRVGAIVKYDIIFNEMSDGCRQMGSLQHLYEIDGVEYDLRRLSNEEAYNKWLEIIAMKNHSSNTGTDIEELVF